MIENKIPISEGLNENPVKYLTPNYDHTEWSYCTLAEIVQRFNDIPKEHERRRVASLKQDHQSDKYIKIAAFGGSILLSLLLFLLGLILWQLWRQ